MYSPEYQWIVPYFFFDDFWIHKKNSNTAFDGCTDEELERMVNSLIVVDNYPRILRKDFNSTIIQGGIVSHTYVYIQYKLIYIYIYCIGINKINLHIYCPHILNHLKHTSTNTSHIRHYPAN